MIACHTYSRIVCFATGLLVAVATLSFGPQHGWSAEPARPIVRLPKTDRVTRLPRELPERIRATGQLPKTHPVTRRTTARKQARVKPAGGVIDLKHESVVLASATPPQPTADRQTDVTKSAAAPLAPRTLDSPGNGAAKSAKQQRTGKRDAAVAKPVAARRSSQKPLAQPVLAFVHQTEVDEAKVNVPQVEQSGEQLASVADSTKANRKTSRIKKNPIRSASAAESDKQLAATKKPADVNKAAKPSSVAVASDSAGDDVQLDYAPVLQMVAAKDPPASKSPAEQQQPTPALADTPETALGSVATQETRKSSDDSLRRDSEISQLTTSVTVDRTPLVAEPQRKRKEQGRQAAEPEQRPAPTTLAQREPAVRAARVGSAAAEPSRNENRVAAPNTSVMTRGPALLAPPAARGSLELHSVSFHGDHEADQAATTTTVAAPESRPVASPEVAPTDTPPPAAPRPTPAPSIATSNADEVAPAELAPLPIESALMGHPNRLQPQAVVTQWGHSLSTELPGDANSSFQQPLLFSHERTQAELDADAVQCVLCGHAVCACSKVRWRAGAEVLALHRSKAGEFQTPLLRSAAGAAVRSHDLDLGFHSGVRFSVERENRQRGSSITGTYYKIEEWTGTATLTGDLTARESVALGTGSGFLRYESAMQNAELTYSKLVGNWSSFLIGFRYLQIDELASLSASTNLFPGFEESIEVRNDLTGGQIGWQKCLWDRGGFVTVDGTVKTGVYYNSLRRNGPNANSQSKTSLANELDIRLRYEVTPAWTATVGYQVLWLTDVALAANQFTVNANQISADETVLLHGLRAGVQYVW